MTEILIVVAIGDRFLVILLDHIRKIEIIMRMKKVERDIQVFYRCSRKKDPSCRIKKGVNVDGAIIDRDGFRDQAVNEFLAEIISLVCVFNDNCKLKRVKEALFVIRGGVGSQKGVVS